MLRNTTPTSVLATAPCVLRTLSVLRVLLCRLLEPITCVLTYRIARRLRPGPVSRPNLGIRVSALAAVHCLLEASAVIATSPEPALPTPSKPTPRRRQLFPPPLARPLWTPPVTTTMVMTPSTAILASTATVALYRLMVTLRLLTWMRQPGWPPVRFRQRITQRCPDDAAFSGHPDVVMNCAVGSVSSSIRVHPVCREVGSRLSTPSTGCVCLSQGETEICF